MSHRDLYFNPRGRLRVSTGDQHLIWFRWGWRAEWQLGWRWAWLWYAKVSPAFWGFDLGPLFLHHWRQP